MKATGESRKERREIYRRIGKRVSGYCAIYNTREYIHKPTGSKIHS